MILRTVKLQPRFALFSLTLILLTSLSVVGLMASSAWLISMASLMPPVLVLSVAVVGVRAFAIGRSVFRYSERLVSHDVAFRMLGQSRLEIFQKLDLDKLFRNPKFRYADIYQRITGDVEQVQDGWLRVILPIFSAASAGVFGFIVLYWLAPLAGVIFLLIFLSALILIPWLVSRFTTKTEALVTQVKSDLVTETLRTYESVEEIAIFGASSDQIKRLTQADQEVNRIGIKRSKFDGFGNALIVFVTGIVITLMVSISYSYYSKGDIAGVNVAVLILLPIAALEAMLLVPLAGILVSRVRESQRRIAELTRDNIKIYSGISPTGLKLKLRNFSSTWKSVNELNPVAIDLDLGEILLITGQSGSGKSSLALGLVNLLPYQGSVTIGGVELRDLPEEQLSKLICFATQDAKIFNTSLRENLLIANKLSTDESLEAVLRVVGLDISSWPKGLETDIGVKGRRLSGGERNRVSIARALLSDAPILILDEPTEYIDPAAAKIMLAQIITFTQGKSLIIISHDEIDLPASVTKRLSL